MAISKVSTGILGKWLGIFLVMECNPEIFHDKGMATWFFPVYRKGPGYFSSFYSVNQKSFSFHFVNQKISAYISSEIILEF